MRMPGPAGNIVAGFQHEELPRYAAGGGPQMQQRISAQAVEHDVQGLAFESLPPPDPPERALTVPQPVVAFGRQLVAEGADAQLRIRAVLGEILLGNAGFDQTAEQEIFA